MKQYRNEWKYLINEIQDRILELEQECFSKETVDKEIQDFHSLVDGQMRKNCERFWGKGTAEKFFDSSVEISEFYEERHKYIQEIVDGHR